MRRAEGLLPDRQRARHERLRLRVPALDAVERTEVGQACGHIGIVRPEGLLLDLLRALEERLRLGVLALGLEEQPEEIQTDGHIGMVRTEGLLVDGQREHPRNGIREVAAEHIMHLFHITPG